jgi:hypothetical protein
MSELETQNLTAVWFPENSKMFAAKKIPAACATGEGGMVEEI